VSTTVGAAYCNTYPNEYLDPIQRMVLILDVIVRCSFSN
jgi:hypothetical protein